MAQTLYTNKDKLSQVEPCIVLDTEHLASKGDQPPEKNFRWAIVKAKHFTGLSTCRHFKEPLILEK